MSSFELCVPTDQVTRALHDAVRRFWDAIVGNVHASRTLAAVRDGLLPKLVSGQLRMHAARRLTAEPPARYPLTEYHTAHRSLPWPSRSRL